MPDLPPRIVLAGDREAGAMCVSCQREIVLGDATAQCARCGAMHHLDCWQQGDRCQSYDCRGEQEPVAPGPAMKITVDELAAATPLPPSVRNSDATDRTPSKPTWNRAALWAMGVALASIPLFGLVTGLIAIVVGCVALAGHRSSQRGLVLAAGAIVLGVASMIGWAFGLSMYLGGGMKSVALDALTIDPESLKELPEHIGRAMRSNVLIQSSFGLGRGSLGSGVVMRVNNGVAYIVTNRHVIDADYRDESSTTPNLQDLGPLTVTTVDQTTTPAKVEWVAPHGVDISIISTPLGAAASDVRTAQWDVAAPPHVGDPVFAIGNPQGLGWTHSGGSVSQVRRRQKNGYSVRIIQSTAAVNPGSSGGGLYDSEGKLVGINTLTADKRFAEGLGFAISLSSLIDLAPERLPWLAPKSQEPPAP